MIELSDVHFAYGSGGFSLDVPCLRVERGRKVALVGPSGSGKTTLLYLIAGILTPLSGTVRVDGRTVSAMGDGERRRFRIAEIGFIFQDLELLEYLSVRENILLPYRINRRVKLTAAARRRAERLAAEAGLDDKLDRYPATLSQGERQRVAICRALAAEPKVVLADEPTSSLDAETAAAVLPGMFELVRRRGATLLMLTHDESLLGRFDRVVRMADLSGRAAA